MTSHHDVAWLLSLIEVCEKAASDERRVLLNPAAVLPIATAAKLVLEFQAKALSEHEVAYDGLMKAKETFRAEAHRNAARALAAEARLAEAMKHIDELTADLGEEIEGRYAGIKLYPSEARRYARDIATVVAARAFTNAAKTQESKDA